MTGGWSRPRVLVVGNGMAGLRLVQEMLDRDPGCGPAITVAGDEPGGAYNRVQLTRVLAGAASPGSITLAAEQWYAERGVRLHAPAEVVRIDRCARLARLADGQAVPYDVLVLATGSSPVLPPADGLVRGDGRLLPGALPLHTRAQCAAIGRLAAGAADAVVVGAGLLGLETACGLAGRGLRVTVLQRGRQVMERQLDSGASRVLSRTLRDLGVQVRAGAVVSAVLGAGRVRGVALTDGTVLGAGLLVLCCGARPRVDLAAAAGLAVATGVVVDDQMRSVTDPRIFAIGDCAEHRGRSYGLVAPAWEQARIAAQAIAQPATAARYPGSLTVTRLKAAGIELASLGDAALVEDDTQAGDAEVIRFTDSARGIYQKIVVRDGRIAGAILIGDTRTVGSITQLFDRGAALPADRATLLLSRRDTAVTTVESPTRLPGQATICFCNGVTKAAICAAWESGARQMSEVVAATRATTGCGTCRDPVEGIVDWLAAADTGPPAGPELDRVPADRAPDYPELTARVTA